MFRTQLLTSLYGVEPGGQVFLLLQHRAGLFLAVAAACVFAAFVPEGRGLASVVTAISMISFLVLYAFGGMPEHLRRIALVDLAGLPVLAIATWFAWKPA